MDGLYKEAESKVEWYLGLAMLVVVVVVAVVVIRDQKASKWNK